MQGEGGAGPPHSRGQSGGLRGRAQVSSSAEGPQLGRTSSGAWIQEEEGVAGKRSEGGSSRTLHSLLVSRHIYF